MNVSVHKRGGSFGTSFKGCGLYLLEGSDRKSQDRVAWTHTKNLATQNPDAAWRVMAATAMDKDRLKAEAGVSKAGRKAGGPVLHMSLSWKDDELENLTPDEMKRAAFGALRFLKAEDRQVLMVAHHDTENPHVHLLVNRVSPTDGTMLKSSNDFRKLSRWAQRYEEENGNIVCPQRVINNAARDRGEYVKGTPRKPRHIHELEAANSNTPDKDKIAEEQLRRDLALRTKTREMRARHVRELAQLAKRSKDARTKTAADAQLDQARAKKRIRAEYRPRWELRFHEHQAELRAFEKREDQVLGRVNNALRSIDFGAIFTGKDRKAAVLDAYNAISTSGGRLEAFKRDQLARDRALEREQKAAETDAAAKVKSQAARKLIEQRAMFKAERASLVLKHGLEHAGNRTEWRTRGQEREAAFGRNRFHGKSGGPAQQQETSGKQTIQDARMERIADSYLRKRIDQDRAREQDNEHDRGDRGR